MLDGAWSTPVVCLRYIVAHTQQFVYDNGDRRQGNEHLEVPCPYIGFIRLATTKGLDRDRILPTFRQPTLGCRRPQALHSAIGMQRKPR